MDSRERVLKAAVELMNKEGLTALSMREVARRAGVSHQAPYHYFENREAILAAIAEEGFKNLNAALESASGRHAADCLVAAGRIYVEFALSHPAHFHVMFRPELVDLRRYPSAQAEASRGFGTLQSLVDGLAKEKFLPARLVRGMTILSWSFVQGLSELLLEGPLAKMSGSNLKSRDKIESALRAFEFLIAGRRKSACK
ncbi:MAG: TetR/AcrR family transcriptional regulator [Acidobacteriaceae bacterium]|nr:TetR/AcrR family transcriptional regulator [Acidobacteriaceae bacterium]